VAVAEVAVAEEPPAAVLAEVGEALEAVLEAEPRAEQKS